MKYDKVLRKVNHFSLSLLADAIACTLQFGFHFFYVFIYQISQILKWTNNPSNKITEIVSPVVTL